MSATERYLFDLTGDLARAAQELDAAFAGAWAPRLKGHVKATRTYAYFGGPELQVDGTIDWIVDGTVVCPDDALSLVQRQRYTGTVVAVTPAVLQEGYRPMAVVRCAGGLLTRFVDARDSVLGTGARVLDDLEDVSLYDLQDDDILTYSAALGMWVNLPGGGGSSLDVEDEGTVQETAVTRLNFSGAGVTAVGDGVGGVDVTIPGGSTQTEALKFLRLKWVVAVHENGTLIWKGFNQPALLGTASAPALGTSSFNASQVKTRQTANAGTNQGAGRVRNGTATSILSLGNAAGVGGYLLSLRFALITLFSGCRGFFGVTGTSPLAGVEPASTTNILGLGWSSSQTNFFLIHNDGSGVATEVDTTVAYATNLVYEVEIDALPNSTGVTVRLYSVDADGRTLLYSATPSTNLPDGAAFLSPHTAINNGTQTSGVVMDFHHWIADTR